ncbi:hypothetical protein OAT59_02195 [Gammaproteobacteria bacterium]|nr:hypothetical protein [Gammaproteobacteria bacterium]
MQLSASYLDKSEQHQFQGCSNPTYPKLTNEYASGSMNAGKIDIRSNGDISLDVDVLIGLNDGQVMASSAIYSKNQNFIQDMKNGNIYHFDNYYKFLNGSLAKDSGEIKLVDGTAYLRERNLLVKYESLAGNLNQSLEFNNASLTACNNSSEGWEIQAKSIKINEESRRGYIEDLSLKILDKTILKLPYLPFPATTKRLSGFLEPELSFTSEGVDLFLPYFWVISDKSDLTIAPRALKDRGIGIEGNYRYLTKSNPNSMNYFDLMFFPEDKEFKKDYKIAQGDRWAFRLKENRSFSNLTTTIDWAKSSDSMVLLDLPSSLTNIANQRDHYLQQSVSINLLVNNFSISILREGFQSLNPFIKNGYIKKPELNLEYQQYGPSVTYFARASYANFDIDKNHFFLVDNKTVQQVGKRFFTEIGAETLQDFRYFDLSINGSFLYKKYNLDDIKINSKATSIPSVKIKISSLFNQSSKDSFSLFIPELVYQRTSFEDQSMDPIFDLHQRNFGNFNRLNTNYFFGKDRVPDTEFLLARLKLQKRMNNGSRLNFQVIKKNELQESRIINAMLNRPIGKDSQIGTNVSFENKIIRAYFAANHSQKRNTLNFGQTGIEIQLPETRLIISRNFQTNVPLLNSENKLDYLEFSIERSISEGYKFIGGISKDLDSKKNLESYFGFGFENCCLAFKIYASDKRLSKYNLLNFQSHQFNNMSWDKMISIENKSRINFEFELKGLIGRNNDKRNRFFSNTLLNL